MTNSVSFVHLVVVYILRFITVPPFGQEQTEELKSVFEIPHLRSSALMLNIQCR